MNRAAKLDAYLDDLCDRASWLALPRLNVDGVDLDTFPARMREHAARARRYAAELEHLADECTNAIGALEEP